MLNMHKCFSGKMYKELYWLHVKEGRGPGQEGRLRFPVWKPFYIISVFF